MARNYTDDVRGIVIGPITWPYQFWRTDIVAGQPMQTRVAKGHFESDEQAVEWFRRNYPDDFAHGVEMRVFGEEADNA